MDVNAQNIIGANAHITCWNDPFFLLFAYCLFFSMAVSAVCRMFSPSLRIRALLETADALRYDLTALVEEGVHEKAVEGLRRQVDDLEKQTRRVQAVYASPTPGGHLTVILRRLPDWDLRHLAARAAQLQKDVKYARNGSLLI
ncbi:hypothetical protein GY45DRAFT_1323696 [Cubamyces sp. BRFM 1775]|nr:hypothetical protein GY45DRAFT_1323696 [Cubamyces sp. BRFM 1775]